jgi:hypothetical protein
LVHKRKERSLKVKGETFWRIMDGAEWEGAKDKLPLLHSVCAYW